MTVNDLINGSFRLINVLASGEAASADMQTDAFNALNDLIDNWSTQGLLVYDRIRETFALTSGQQTYTMGTGGNFNTSRPQFIENCLIVDTSVTPNTELPITIIDKDEWAEIPVKAIQGTWPLKVYVDNANPLVNLNFWPIPGASKSVGLYSWKPIAEFASVNTTLALPPGYQMALRYSLAIILAPEYGKSVAPEVASVAQGAVADIKRMNIRPKLMQTDDALKTGSARVFNWRIGQ